jgi:hypothetical protein
MGKPITITLDSDDLIGLLAIYEMGYDPQHKAIENLCDDETEDRDAWTLELEQADRAEGVIRKALTNAGAWPKEGG